MRMCAGNCGGIHTVSEQGGKSVHPCLLQTPVNLTLLKVDSECKIGPFVMLLLFDSIQ